MRETKGTTGYRKRKANDRAERTLQEYLSSLPLEKLTALLNESLDAGPQRRDAGEQKPKPAEFLSPRGRPVSRRW
jgi:hypothetical protein